MVAHVELWAVLFFLLVSILVKSLWNVNCSQKSKTTQE